MNFSKDSEVIMNYLMINFKSFYKKKTSKEQVIFDKIITKFYNNINIANDEISLLLDSHKIKRKIYEINNAVKYTHSKILNSSWVPDNIKRYIKTNTKGKIHYHGFIRNKSINITVYLVKNNQFNELTKVDNLIKKMFTWLYFIIPYTNQSCSKSLSVYCYLCPHRKLIPSAQFKILGPKNVNSGLAGTCSSKGEICIYRTEEIFKVFVHETFHAFGLDWSAHDARGLNTKLKNLFPITSEMNSSETYTEFWATIFNSLFVAYYLRNDKSDIDEFILYAEYCIHFEQMFSMFQCAKILQFMGIHYKTLYEKDDLNIKARKILYKERSNVFTYYILKMIILVNADKFILWCEKNNDNIINFNKTEANLDKFYTFIKKHYNSKNLLKDLNEMHKILKDTKKISESIITTTTRMTVIETH